MNADKQSGRMEVLVAALLGASALGASWAGYQATLWSSTQAQHQARAGALRTKASAAAVDASLQRTVEILLFSDWLAAASEGDERLANFYRDRFPVTFRPAFEAWQAQQPLTNPRAAPTPFVLPSYRQARAAEAAELNAGVDAQVAATAKAKRNANSFTRTSVIFAMAIFLGSAGRTFQQRRLQGVLALMAFVVFGVGLAQLATLPAIFHAG